MSNYDKAIQDAESALEKAISREDWSGANQKDGFLVGVRSYKHNAEKGQDAIYRAKAETEKDLEYFIERGNYGNAAFCLSWLSGYMTGETAYRLDELEKLAAEEKA